MYCTSKEDLRIRRERKYFFASCPSNPNQRKCWLRQVGWQNKTSIFFSLVCHLYHLCHDHVLSPWETPQEDQSYFIYSSVRKQQSKNVLSIIQGKQTNRHPEASLYFPSDFRSYFMLFCYTHVQYKQNTISTKCGSFRIVILQCVIRQ